MFAIYAPIWLTHMHTDLQGDAFQFSGAQKQAKNERANGAKHCDGDKVHERIIAVNAWPGAGSFVRQSAERLIESDR